MTPMLGLHVKEYILKVFEAEDGCRGKGMVNSGYPSIWQEQTLVITKCIGYIIKNNKVDTSRCRLSKEEKKRRGHLRPAHNY